MTSSRMGRLYVDEARGRVILVQVAIEKGLWAATVREADLAWFRSAVDRLATISTAGDRGLAFYGDERQELGPQELFDEADTRRAKDLAFHSSP